MTGSMMWNWLPSFPFLLKVLGGKEYSDYQYSSSYCFDLC